MKYILFTMLCAMFLAANAQVSCDTWVIKKYDKMTGNTSFESKKAFIILDSKQNGISILVTKGEMATILGVTVHSSERCIKSDAQMIVLFRDGQRLMINNNTEFNCDGNFFAYFSEMHNSFNNLKLLSLKEIESIRVWTASNYVDVNLTSKQSADLKSLFECFDKNEF